MFNVGLAVLLTVSAALLVISFAFDLARGHWTFGGLLWVLGVVFWAVGQWIEVSRERRRRNN